MREINKLRSAASVSAADTPAGAAVLEVSACQTLCDVQSDHSRMEELRTQTDQLKNDLSATRVRLRALQSEYEELQKVNASSSSSKAGRTRSRSRNRSRNRRLSAASNESDRLSPESSAYHSDATVLTHLTAKSGRGPLRHLRAESNVTARTAYSEGNEVAPAAADSAENDPLPATPPVPREAVSPQWARYIEHLKCKNRRTNKLWVRADNGLKRAMKGYCAIYTLHIAH